LERELATKLLLDILYSPSSANYQELYNEHLISDNFGTDYSCGKDYSYSMFGGDTRDPDLLLKRVREQIDKALEQGIREADFERSRRKKIGGFLRMLNSPEAIAHEFTKYQFKGCNLFDILPVYERLTLDRINRRLREHFNWNQLAVSIVRKDEN